MHAGQEAIVNTGENKFGESVIDLHNATWFFHRVVKIRRNEEFRGVYDVNGRRVENPATPRLRLCLSWKAEESEGVMLVNQ